jgi:TonB family protein
MVFVIVIVTIVFGISLYDYFSSRDVHELNSSTLLFKNRNKRYGAFVLRNSYAPVMLGVTLSTLFLFGISVGAHYGTKGMGDWHSKYETEQQIVDTTFLSLEPPPEDPLQLPQSYKMHADQGNRGKNNADQEEIQEIKDASRQSNDQPDNPNAQNPPQKDNQKANLDDIKDDIHAMDDYFQNVSKAAADRANARKERERNKTKPQTAQTASGENKKQSEEREGSSNAYVVPYFKSNRQWSYLAEPPFTCEEGGVVVVDIVVDSYGNVTSAQVASSYENKPQCLKEQARKYAFKTKFKSSSKQSEQGTITYTFKAQ